MCGIVAVFSFSPAGLFLKDLEIFEQLHKVIALRGEDGAGLFYVADKASGFTKIKDENESFVSWAKVATNPYDLYTNAVIKKQDEAIRQSRFMVGHVRFATQGNVTAKNAHPFQSADQRITLVHNGNILYTPDIKNLKKYEVDSMALTDALGKNVDPTRVLKETTGAIATIWYDKKNMTINVYRNDDRPLVFMEQYKTMYIASEKGALSWVLGRNQTSNTKIEDFESGYHYSWNHNGDLTKVMIKEPKKAWEYNYGRNHREHEWNYDGWSAESPYVPTNVRLLPSMVSSSNNNTEVIESGVVNPPSSVVRKFKPTEEYLGLKRGDTVFIDVINHSVSDDESLKFSLVGSFAGTTSATVQNLGLFADLLVNTTIKATSREEILEQIRNDFFQGKIVSILVNTNDATDVKIYVKETSIITPEEKDKYWKGNHVVMEYRPDFAPERILH